ncbi:hypothetical protein SAMN06265365_101295 [Tistlia consotensis]|uniref:Uncharacterized protein n=1 Tax=Tistlia consotensis USBA 355 TaxID=560819 RepID=A0A1Y6B6B4_9PROT|nr:hypothetical protein [Tistlia consotensis]SME90289.1 hypothetical protein SAMN05428998_101293 [Tistlia consotensis USBA 355]SNR26594.1 hypothetical protein SAMN06265365_101295 [Tistlia consotensis]
MAPEPSRGEPSRGEPSRAIRLYGTEQQVAPPLLLRAGRLTAEFEAGNLRYIRLDGLELLRAVSFIVRDRNWGTYDPEIANLEIDQVEGRFRVSYDAVTKDAGQAFRYRAVIEGREDGLAFRAQGEALSDFVTNRTGFVVLHPAGLAGLAVEMEKVDGSRVAGRFPELIDPVQPMMDLRCLTHEAAPGLTVACRLEGEAYEMEDQRNWTDASYKTYVRPLAKPWPYTLEAGSRLEQSVTLTISGRAPARAAGGEALAVTIGAALGPAPSLGLGLDPDEIGPSGAVAAALAEAGAGHLVCHYDPRRGHDRTALERSAALAARLGATPWLEAVIATVEAAGQEVAALGETVAALGSPFEVVLLSPAPDLKCTLPGSVWPPAPDAEALFRAARQAFPKARLGGGMFSYFTELNRKRPPTALIDLVSFTTSALVHAGDDRSAMEGLESLPAIAASARAIAGGLPVSVGPSAIGMRQNPYGAAPMDNPDNLRQAMNFNDPRQRGLFNAAWTLGYYSRFAAGGAEAIAVGGTTGPFGLVHTPQPWPTPGWERQGALYPAFHVVRGLARLAGRPLSTLDSPAPSRLQGVAVETAEGRELWLANLTAEPLRVSLPAAARGVALLDAERFVEAAGDSGLADRLSAPADPGALTLDAYAVARVRLA